MKGWLAYERRRGWESLRGLRVAARSARGWIGWGVVGEDEDEDEDDGLHFHTHFCGRGFCTAANGQLYAGKCFDGWEKQRTRGNYEEGLKKAAKGDALVPGAQERRRA